MEKLRYELDPFNRLVETTIGHKGAIIGLRRVLDGYFEASGSTLTYHLKSPVPAGRNALEQLTLKGNWSLNKEHELVFTLDNYKRQVSGDRLTFKGELIDAKSNSLAYSVGTRTQGGKSSFYLFALEGAWQADANNRLSFKLKQERGQPDTLTFEGAWEVDKNYRLIYRYEKKQGKRQEKEVQALAFEGHWEIADNSRISYILSAATNSRFDFKASFARFEGRQIKYEVGILVSSREKPVTQSITFAGRWMLSKKVGLVFEAPCAGNRMQSFAFGCQLKLSDKDTLVCALRNSANRSLGAEVELSREIFNGNGRVFLRALEEKGSAAFFIGAGWKW